MVKDKSMWGVFDYNKKDYIGPFKEGDKVICVISATDRNKDFLEGNCFIVECLDNQLVVDEHLANHPLIYPLFKLINPAVKVLNKIKELKTKYT